MEYLTATILSGMLYDGVKSGFKITYDFLKSNLSGWNASEQQVSELLRLLEDEGFHEDMGQHAIKRKIQEKGELSQLLRSITADGQNTIVIQTSDVGNNVYIAGEGTVKTGDIKTKQE